MREVKYKVYCRHVKSIFDRLSFPEVIVIALLCVCGLRPGGGGWRIRWRKRRVKKRWRVSSRGGQKSLSHGALLSQGEGGGTTT